MTDKKKKSKYREIENELKAQLPLRAAPPEVQLEVLIDDAFSSIRVLQSFVTRRYVDRGCLEMVQRTTVEIAQSLEGIIADFNARGEAYVDMSKVQT